MDMDAISDLTSRIESLSPEEIEEFQKAIINLPTSSESDYKAELDKFLEEFNAKTEGKEAYVLADKNEIKSFDDIFKARYDKGYNADEIIKHRDNQNILSSILELEAQKNNINSILDSATTEEAASEDLIGFDWNAGGEVITFTNNGDGSWSTSYGYNTGINYGGTYDGGYSGGYYTGGFDVFATGGGSSSGSASFDAFCEAMMAGWREIGREKSESARDKRVHAQLVCQPEACE